MTRDQSWIPWTSEQAKIAVVCSTTDVVATFPSTSSTFSTTSFLLATAATAAEYNEAAAFREDDTEFMPTKRRQYDAECASAHNLNAQSMHAHTMILKPVG